MGAINPILGARRPPLVPAVMDHGRGNIPYRRLPGSVTVGAPCVRPPPLPSGGPVACVWCDLARRHGLLVHLRRGGTFNRGGDGGGLRCTGQGDRCVGEGRLNGDPKTAGDGCTV